MKSIRYFVNQYFNIPNRRRECYDKILSFEREPERFNWKVSPEYNYIAKQVIELECTQSFNIQHMGPKKKNNKYA